MTEHKRLAENIQTRMAFYVHNLRISNDRDHFDENKEAEYFFCKPLSLLFDADVTNANSGHRNFPGIDLADKKEGICFQITSTNTKRKVQHTLDEFLKHRLDEDFDRLIVLIVTLDTPPKCADLRFDRPFDFDVKRDVWNISRLVQEFTDLPADRRHVLRSFSDYLDQELPSLEAPKPRLELPLYSALQVSGFVGRQPELEEIRSRFSKGDKLVVLTGLGGIGKTELAVQYGRTHGGKVYFAPFDGSFTRTLANMALGIRPALSEEQLRQDEKALSSRVLKLLEESDEKDLLIIDNANSPTGALAELQRDGRYQTLCRCPLRLLLTTRSHAPRAMEVGAMPRDPLFEIFTKHGAVLEPREMEDLIGAVNGHTLTVDLIARTLSSGGLRTVTAERMLKALQENTLPKEKYRRIATDYHQSTEQVQIYQHLSTVFDLSDMSDGEKTLLGIATLFPENGIDGDLIADVVSEEEAERFEALIDRGWLEKKDALLTIHPIIRLVCRTEIPPADEDCGDFLGGLLKQYNKFHYRQDRYRQMAEMLTNASRFLEDANGDFAWWAARLWRALGAFRPELECSLRTMEKLEAILPPEHPQLAGAYNNVGLAFSDLGDHKRALGYQKKALAIREKLLPSAPSELAQSYNNVGHAYSNLGDHKKALKYLQLGLDIRKKLLPADHPDLATSYNNVGGTYGDLGNYKKALEYLLKAQGILEKVLPADHPDLALSYNNAGSAYSDLGDNRKALEYHQKALAIWTKALPPDHPNLAASCNNVGDTYCKLGDLKKSLEYLLRALSICEKALPSDHPKLATCCNNIAGTYHAMGRLREAAQYMRRAADVISSTSLPEEHPDRVNYPVWADQFEKDAQMQQDMLEQLQKWSMEP